MPGKNSTKEDKSKKEIKICPHCEQPLEKEDEDYGKWCGYCFTTIHRKCSAPCPMIDSLRDAEMEEDFEYESSDD